jgi:hypothetical protein
MQLKFELVNRPPIEIKDYLCYNLFTTSFIKGTVARDYWALVFFFMHRTHLAPLFMSYYIFEFGFEFAEIFVFEV